MLGILLKNDADTLGLALIAEQRKVKNVVYLSRENNLQLTFDNGEIEPLITEIDSEFGNALYKMKRFLIAHFADMNLANQPLDEYFVPLFL